MFTKGNEAIQSIPRENDDVTVTRGLQKQTSDFKQNQNLLLLPLKPSYTDLCPQ